MKILKLVFIFIISSVSLFSQIKWETIHDNTEIYMLNSIDVNGGLLAAGGYLGGVKIFDKDLNSIKTVRAPLEKDINDIVITDEQKIFCAFANGDIYKSGDLGDSWNIAGSFQDIVLNTIDYGNGMLAAGGNSGRIYVSENEGNDWKDRNIPDTVNVNEILINNAKTWAVCGNGKLFTSLDFGENWQEKVFEEKFDLKNINIYGDTVYVSGDSTIFYASYDGGENWKVFALGNKPTVIVNPFIHLIFNKGNILSYILMDEFSTDFWNYISTDGGQTWENKFYSGSDLRLIRDYVYSGGSIYGAGISGTIIKANTGPDGFIQIEHSKLFGASSPGRVFTFDGSVFFGFFGENGLVRSVNLKNWEPVDMPRDSSHRYWMLSYTDINMLSNNKIIVTGTYDTITVNGGTIKTIKDGFFVVTEDGGKSWDLVMTTPGYSTNFTSMANENYGISDYLGYNILLTTDGGHSWSEVALPEGNITMKFVLCPKPGLFIVRTYDINEKKYKLIRSTDGGASWETIEYTSDQVDKFVYTDENTGIRENSNEDKSEYYIERTGDYGDTWEKILSCESLIRDFDFFDEDNGFVIIGKNQFAITSDGGKNWEYYKPFDDEIIANYVSYINYQTAVISAVHFYIKMSREPNSVEKITDSNSLIISPNPARSRILVRSENIHSGEIRISNIKGEIIYRDKFNGSGEISTSNWPAGVYFVTISGGRKTQYGKLIVSD